MASKIAEVIIQKLLTSSTIEECDRELYRYGFFLLINHVIFFFITFFVGALAGIPAESILFYFSFMLLRTYAGGVHAKTEMACTILTTFSLCASILAIKNMKDSNSGCVALIILVIGGICVLLLSPLDSEEKPLSDQERKKYKRVCFLLVSLNVFISLSFPVNTIYYSLACAMGLAAILLVIGKIRELLRKRVVVV